MSRSFKQSVYIKLPVLCSQTSSRQPNKQPARHDPQRSCHAPPVTQAGRNRQADGMPAHPRSPRAAPWREQWCNQRLCRSGPQSLQLTHKLAVGIPGFAIVPGSTRSYSGRLGTAPRALAVWVLPRGRTCRYGHPKEAKGRWKAPTTPPPSPLRRPKWMPLVGCRCVCPGSCWAL